MSDNLGIAADLYLRGFSGGYIKLETGISVQSLLKQLLAKGISYTPKDIINYQISYISSRYAKIDIINAYRNASALHDDLYKASRGKHIHMLGCGFGNYKVVFVSIIGADSYKQLRNECWQNKQQKTMQDLYSVSNVFDKQTFSRFVSSNAISLGRKKRTDTMINRYGVIHPNQHKGIAAKMQQSLISTNIDKYGVPYPTQRPDVARKVASSRQKTMLDRYGAKNSVEVKTIRDKIFKNRKRNGTLNTSKPEKMLGVILKDRFGDNDVVHDNIIDERYPYRVDYYIKSLDLFIELNGDTCHYNHWFDANSEDDQRTLNGWLERAASLEQETGKCSRYRRYADIWTRKDVEKRQKAKLNDLNYLVFWDGSCAQRNKQAVPVLSDAHDWFNDGCPMPKKWRPENTY